MIFLLIILAIGSPKLFAENRFRAASSPEIRKTAHLIAMASDADYAGALGSMGARIAWTYKLLNLKELSSQLRLEEFPNRSKIGIGQIAMTKGLAIPLDIGFKFAKISQNVTMASGALKWTFFEAFQLPSLASKISLGKMWGIQGLKAWTRDFELMLSYRPSRYIIFQANRKFSWQNQNFSNSPKYYGKSTSKIATVNLGVKYFFLPPSFAISLEHERYSTKNTSFTLGILVTT